MKKNKLFKLLYKSFDTEIAASEKNILENELLSNHELKKFQYEVSELRNDIRNFGRENFPEDFETGLFRKVNPIFLMREVHGRIPDAFTSAFREVSLSGAIVLALLLLYNLNAGNNKIIKNFLGITPATIEYAAYDPAEKLMWTDSK